MSESEMMRAMVLMETKIPLELHHLARPKPAAGQALIRVEACGVCRTDVHIIDDELPKPKLPLVPGHEIVGRIEALGEGVSGFESGQRVGVPWLGHACGDCDYCRAERENLCDTPLFTGYNINGGYAEYCVAHTDFMFELPDAADPVALAPLLCAGLIGYRCLVQAGDAKTIGLYGFGAAAHILCQIAVWQGRNVLAFTREDDFETQKFARSLGASWAGDSTKPAPEPLDAAIIFAPDGKLVPQALRAVRKGGRVICGGIHMSDIPAMRYDELWGERQIRSIANLTRADGEAFFAQAEQAGLMTKCNTYRLEQANQAVVDIREGRITGAAVLVP